MHLLEFCAAVPFTCFYVCLILSSVVYLYPSEMFKDLSARFSKIFQCNPTKLSKLDCNTNLMFPPLLKLWKGFHCLWEFYYPWSLDLRICAEKYYHKCRHLWLSKFSLFLNLFSWSSPYFWDLLSINFGFRKWFANWW